VDGPALFKQSGLDNLTVITSGEPPPNPAELLSAARFRSLLTVASHSYDQIIVDAPPLLGLADAPIIATAVDGTMLVIEAGRGRIGAVRGALKRLMAVRARIVGTALVKYDAKAAGFAYGYGYGYGGSEYYYYNHSEGAEGGGRKRRRLGRA
jgi:Mrp family chromosome partitioning ATPase